MVVIGCRYTSKFWKAREKADIYRQWATYQSLQVSKLRSINSLAQIPTFWHEQAWTGWCATILLILPTSPPLAPEKAISDRRKSSCREVVVARWMKNKSSQTDTDRLVDCSLDPGCPRQVFSFFFFLLTYTLRHGASPVSYRRLCAKSWQSAEELKRQDSAQCGARLGCNTPYQHLISATVNQHRFFDVET